MIKAQSKTTLTLSDREGSSPVTIEISREASEALQLLTHSKENLEYSVNRVFSTSQLISKLLLDLYNDDSEIPKTPLTEDMKDSIYVLNELFNFLRNLKVVE